MKASVVAQAIACVSVLSLSTALSSGQGISNGGLQYMQTIGIPGWGQTGATQRTFFKQPTDQRYAVRDASWR